MFHVNKQTKSFFNKSNFDYFKSKLVLNAGVTANLTDYTRVTGFIDYYIQGQYRQLFLGGLYHYDVDDYEDSEKCSLGLGLFYRVNDAIVPVVKLDYKQLTLGISYDVNISALKSASMYRGGLELTMNYKTYFHIPNSTLDKMRCVRF